MGWGWGWGGMDTNGVEMRSHFVMSFGLASELAGKYKGRLQELCL